MVPDGDMPLPAYYILELVRLRFYYYYYDYYLSSQFSFRSDSRRLFGSWANANDLLHQNIFASRICRINMPGVKYVFLSLPPNACPLNG